MLDSGSQWCSYFCQGVKIHSRPVNMSELRSAQLGLDVAKNFMDAATGVILEGDSAFACATINRILSGTWNGVMEGLLARSLKDYPKFVLSLVDRRANSVADYVANSACRLNFNWDRGMPLPQALSFILSKDMVPM
ncbi:hypothetical protein KSP40_PGU011364 [Platanthera guangdongensis]|uniref:RNase H type-1 domain-containing protein n=1 Tax=Platanthera guangdongensis TaxID=2320717 RepID=A0ABR2LVM7_9ASPA